MFKSQLSSFSAFSAVIFLLTHCEGQSQVVGGPPPVVALVGDDVVLPCHLEAGVNAVSMILEWGRLDLKPRFVHVWHEGQDLLVNQNPSYRGRTSLSIEKLKHGDLSLKLSEVKISDNGKYRCFIPKLNRESTVQLVVGAVSSPVIVSIDRVRGGVVLQCECKGWYPEPEVLWLDGEGNLLSAGPTETVRGPDDLYTVSSRVTVEKRHSNSFTCRVQQNHINQIRDTHITVAADVINVSSSSAVRTSIVLAVGFICLLAVGFVLWKWQRNNTKDETHQREAEVLMTKGRQKEAELEQLIKEKQKNIADVVELLEEQKKEVENQRDQLKRQREEMEREWNKTENMVQSVENEYGGDKTNGYFKLKEIILQNKQVMQKRKQNHEVLLLNTNKLLEKTKDVLKKMTEVEKKEEIR